MSYNAIVARIHTRPHPNADKLQLGTVAGSQVVVGLDTPDGALGVYFPCDGQLSEEFCSKHDLISRIGADGKHEGGFFAHNRRVRIQKLRGEKSDGFWAPLSYFSYVYFGGQLLGTPPLDELAEGFQFTELNGHHICNKYVTEATARAQNNQAKQPAKTNSMFAKHFETEQLRRHLNEIPAGALIILTEKMHGTSHRLGKVIGPVGLSQLRWKLRLHAILSKWLLGRQPSAWQEIHGSRNAVLSTLAEDGFHGGNFRETATHPLKGQLHKGEVIYGEIVGYAGEKPIMNSQDTDKLKDKAILKQYGPVMTYAYGQAPGTCKFYAYRITQVNEDGQAVELSWFQVKARCKELGVPHVKEYVSFLHWPDAIHDAKTGQELFEEVVGSLTSGSSHFDKSHMREGVCIRVEHETGTTIYKSKSYEFLVLEDALKEKDDVVDTEEAA